MALLPKSRNERSPDYWRQSQRLEGGIRPRERKTKPTRGQGPQHSNAAPASLKSSMKSDTNPRQPPTTSRNHHCSRLMQTDPIIPHKSLAMGRAMRFCGDILRHRAVEHRLSR